MSISWWCQSPVVPVTWRLSSSTNYYYCLNCRKKQKRVSSNVRRLRILSLTNPSSSSSSSAEVDSMVTVKNKALEVLPSLRGTSIFLIGMKSAVKTNLAQILADAFRYYYFDSDNLVEEAAAAAGDGHDSSGTSFKLRDRQGFHESESEVLKQLSSMGRLVVCAGDGAVQSSANLALLRHGLSICIDVPLDVIAREILENGTQVHSSEILTSGSHSEVVDKLTVLYEEARGGYATADATVSLYGLASQLGYDDLNDVTKEELALEVLKEIEKLTRVKKMMEEAAIPF